MLSDKYESILPEDTYKNHLSILNRSLLQQFKVSTQSLTNASSQILLKNVWQTNKDSYENNSEDILKCVKNITKGKETNNCKTWKSSLSMIEEPISLFEKNLTKCLHCDQSHLGLSGAEQLLKNKCCCNINLCETTENLETENYTNNKTQYGVKSLNSDNFIDEAKSVEDGKQLYKPKFGRPKLPKVSNQPSTSKNTPIYPDVDLEKEDEMKAHKSNVSKLLLKTAKEQLLASNPAAKRTLGTSRKAQAKFVSPMIGAQEKPEINEPEVTDERLKHIDPKMIELIESEIIDKGAPIGWDDIAGLKMAKSVIQEAVVWPMLRPDIFTGLRRPPKGILLFGPPGTGKTLIGKCVAAQCNATFFSISASSLTSKWIGDGEKMVRALFAVATCHQPAVIFIDEIDSLLTQRSDTEHEATRRIKTEFLVQFDGASTTEDERVLIVGATNRPHELDEAARRRLVKRLYIPLPDEEARTQIISNLLRNENSSVSAAEARAVSRLAAGYSGADVRALCAEAAMGPVRALPLAQMASISRDEVRPVNIQDFKNALERVKPSVSQDDLGQYEKWNNTYGQGF